MNEALWTCTALAALCIVAYIVVGILLRKHKDSLLWWGGAGIGTACVVLILVGIGVGVSSARHDNVRRAECRAKNLPTLAQNDTLSPLDIDAILSGVCR